MAGAAITVDVAGADELVKALRLLPEKILVKVARPALRAGAKVMLRAVRAEISAQGLVRSGRMRDTFRVKPLKRRRGARARVGFIVISGRRPELQIPATSKKGKPSGYYPVHLMLGYLTRRSEKPSAKDVELGTRKVAARPFLKKALRDSEAAARAEVLRVMGERLKKETLLDAKQVIDAYDVDVAEAS